MLICPNMMGSLTGPVGKVQLALSETKTHFLVVPLLYILLCIEEMVLLFPTQLVFQRAHCPTATNICTMCVMSAAVACIPGVSHSVQPRGKHATQ